MVSTFTWNCSQGNIWVLLRLQNDFVYMGSLDYFTRKSKLSHRLVSFQRIENIVDIGHLNNKYKPIVDEMAEMGIWPLLQLGNWI